MMKNFLNVDIRWTINFLQKYYKMFVIINFFLQKWGFIWKFGLSLIQKCIVALCMFAHKRTTDVIDEYYQLAKNTLMEWMKFTMHDVVASLQPRYLQESQK